MKKTKTIILEHCCWPHKPEIHKLGEFEVVSDSHLVNILEELRSDLKEQHKAVPATLPFGTPVSVGTGLLRVIVIKTVGGNSQ